MPKTITKMLRSLCFMKKSRFKNFNMAKIMNLIASLFAYYDICIFSAIRNP